MVYWVKYKLHRFDLERGTMVAARNKYEAWDKAEYEVIPKIEGELPYSAWVASVTYQNGKHRDFKSFEGNPFGE